MESVSASTQNSLRTLGVNALVTQEGENVRIAWRSVTGSKTSFVLTRVRTEQGENTRVRLEVDKGADAKAGFQLLADLETKHGKAHL